jgi:hypothetical protein
VIAENLRHEQRKVIKYNHLVANMVILHNVVGMSRVLKQLQAEGAVINQEILAGLGSIPIGAHQSFRRLRSGFPAQGWSHLRLRKAGEATSNFAVVQQNESIPRGSGFIPTLPSSRTMSG